MLSSKWNYFFSILYCSEKEHIIKYKITGAAAHCSIFPLPVIDNLTQSKYDF